MGLFAKKQKVELAVQGMTCGHCEMRVSKALKGVPGVVDATVSHERARAIVTVKGEVGIDALIDAVKNAGYTASSAG